MKYLIIFILITGCVKSEYGFKPAPPGLTAKIVEQLIKIEEEYKKWLIDLYTNVVMF